MSCCTYHTTSTECFSLGYRSAHILLVALAISDICFSLAIHPMLVVTSFGIPSEQLFGKTGLTSSDMVERTPGNQDCEVEGWGCLAQTTEVVHTRFSPTSPGCDSQRSKNFSLDAAEIY